MLKDLFKEDKGAALALTFIVMLIVIGFGTAILTLSNTEYNISQNDYEAQKALYLADAGVSYAIYLIDKSKTNLVPYEFYLSPDQKIKVSQLNLDTINQKWIVKTVGYYGKVTKEVNVDLELVKGDNVLDKLKEVQVAILQGGTIDFGNNGTITGNIYYSDIAPTGIQYPNTVPAGTYGVFQTPSLIVNYIDLYKAYTAEMTKITKAQINTAFVSPGGAFYYDGSEGIPTMLTDITYTGKSIFYVKGDLIIKSSITYPGTTNSNGDFMMIICDGKVTIQQDANDKINCIICAKTIDLTNANAEVSGVIVATNTVIPNANQNFYTYQPLVVQGIDLENVQLNKQYKISNWRIVH